MTMTGIEKVKKDLEDAIIARKIYKEQIRQEMASQPKRPKRVYPTKEEIRAKRERDAEVAAYRKTFFIYRKPDKRLVRDDCHDIYFDSVLPQLAANDDIIAEIMRLLKLLRYTDCKIRVASITNQVRMFGRALAKRLEKGLQ